MKNKKFILFLPFVLLVLIFGASSIPNLGNIPLARALFFKILAHISAFTVLTFSIIAAIETYLPKTEKSDFLEILLLTITIIIIVFVVALLSEYYQALIPGRGVSLKDIGFDTIGILLAVGAWHIIKALQKINLSGLFLYFLAWLSDFLPF